MSKQIDQLRKQIKEIIAEIEAKKKLKRETTTTGNVAGYDTPRAFNPDGTHKKEYVKRMAGLTGYTAVNESVYYVAKQRSKHSGKTVEFKIKDTEVDKYVKTPRNLVDKLNKAGFELGSGHDGVEFEKLDSKRALLTAQPYVGAFTQQVVFVKKNITENRLHKLRLDTKQTPNQKIGVGIREIRKKIDEIEKFLEWYGRIKQENSMTGDKLWKRTNRHIHKIKERLAGLRKGVSFLKK